MTLLWHLVRADLRRFRMVLAIWVAVVAASALISAMQPGFVDQPPLRQYAGIVDALLNLAKVLLTFLIVATIVQEHAAVGTDAFWMTRPIPRMALVSSKLLLLVGAIVIVPAAIDWAQMAAYQFPLRTIAGVVAESTLLRMLLLGLLTAAASLTPTLTRFLLLCGGTVVAVAAVVSLVLATQMGQLDDTPPVESGAFENDPTGDVVFNILIVVSLLILVAVQYRVRRRTWAIGLSATAAVVAYVVSSVWPWSFVKPIALVPDWAQQRIQVDVDTSTISTHTPQAFFPTQRTQWSTVRGGVNVHGLAPGWSADMSIREASLRLTDGRVLNSVRGARSSLAVLFGGDGMHPPAVVRETLGVTVLHEQFRRMQPEPQRQDLPTLFVIRQEELARYAPASGEYLARAAIRLTNYAVEGVVPLQPGARHQSDHYRLTVDDIVRRDRGIAIVAREQRANSIWDKRPWSMYTFYLRNQTHRDALLVSDHSGFSSDFAWSLMPGYVGFGSVASGFLTRGLLLTLFPYERQMATFIPDDEWLSGAELVILRRTEEGAVERTLQITEFPLDIARPEGRASVNH